ncbi:MAG: hypothetical protein OXC26_08130 [Albidovulum sp.]|nr:hypothetical protein [Albidovulum sp.]
MVLHWITQEGRQYGNQKSRCRDPVSAGTKEALRAKKAAGLPLGRPKGPGESKLDPFRPEVEAMLANGSTRKFIAKRCGTTPANLSNWLGKNGIRKPAQ